MKYVDSLIAADGQPIIDYDSIQKFREADKKERNPYRIIAQRGGQENILSSNADIIICGGSRGGSKTFSILLEILQDYYQPNLRALLLRHDKDSLRDIVDTSEGIYNQFGTYNRSKDDMTWKFDVGATIKFSYHEGAIQDFKRRFRGHQYARILIDEITQIEYEKFKFIITCLRNAFGIKNRFIGTCNPETENWVAEFIDWWLDKDGYPIPERDGLLRYCFMDGEDVSQIIWGNSREEVYLQAKDIIDKYMTPELRRYGKPEDIFVKSVSFVEAKLYDNIQLLRSDPSYIANLAGQSEEQRMMDLGGCWKPRIISNEMLKREHLEQLFNNAFQYDDNVRRASCDVAFDGGDMLVMWLFIGKHIQDIFTCQVDSKTTVSMVNAKLKEWNVLQENFTYDLNGIGQIFKGFFPDAKPFNNMAAPLPEYKYLYRNLKSQAAYMFVMQVKNHEWSINPDLLERKFSAKKYTDKKLTDILMMERKSIIKDEKQSSRGFSIIPKEVMKKIVGNSPDFIEALYMIEIFFINKSKKKHNKPKGILRYTSPI